MGKPAPIPVGAHPPFQVVLAQLSFVLHFVGDSSRFGAQFVGNLFCFGGGVADDNGLSAIQIPKVLRSLLELF